MARHIGIDTGTESCGYAYTDNGKPHAILSGTWNLKPKRWESSNIRFDRYRVSLEELITKAPDGDVFIWIEEVSQRQYASAALIYGGWMAIHGLLEARYPNVRFGTIPVKTIKQRATGKGNAGKPAMIEAAREAFCDQSAFDKMISDDNQADALWVLQCGLDEMRENQCDE